MAGARRSGMRGREKRFVWSFSDRRFRVDQLVTFGSVRLSREACGGVDSLWIPQRQAQDRHGWRWRRVYEDGREVFALVDGSDQHAALWASAAGAIHPADRNLKVPYYRLDYFEVAPSRRGDDLTAAFAMAVASSYALRWGAQAVVALVLKASEPFYERVGFTPAKLKGWKLESDVVPWCLVEPKFDEACEVANDAEEAAAEATS